MANFDFVQSKQGSDVFTHNLTLTLDAPTSVTNSLLGVYSNDSGAVTDMKMTVNGVQYNPVQVMDLGAGGKTGVFIVTNIPVVSSVSFTASGSNPTYMRGAVIEYAGPLVLDRSTYKAGVSGSAATYTTDYTPITSRSREILFAVNVGNFMSGGPPGVGDRFTERLNYELTSGQRLSVGERVVDYRDAYQSSGNAGASNYALFLQTAYWSGDPEPTVTHRSGIWRSPRLRTTPQQPQQAVRVSSRWLSRGLRFAFLPSVGWVNLATGQTATEHDGAYTRRAGRSGIMMVGGKKARFPASVDINRREGLTLISLWRAADNEYFNIDGKVYIMSSRTSGNQGWTWGRNGADGNMGSGGNVTRQIFTLQGIAEHTEDNFSIASFIDTPVACRYNKHTSTISWFAFGKKSSPDITGVSSSSTVGGDIVLGTTGEYDNDALNSWKWIGQAGVVLAFEGPLSDTEIYELTHSASALWSVFETPSRTLPVSKKHEITTGSWRSKAPAIQIRKPSSPAGFVLNRDNPLTAGIESLLVPTFGGSSVFDVIGNSLVPVTGDLTYYQGSKRGPDYGSLHVSGTITSYRRKISTNPVNRSIAFAGFLIGSAGNIAGLTNDSSAPNEHIGMYLMGGTLTAHEYNTGSLALSLGEPTAGPLAMSQSARYVGGQASFHAVAAYGGNIVENGATPSDPTTPWYSAWSTTRPFFNVGHNAYGSGGIDGVVYMAVCWNRALSTHEMRSFVQNPWQLFRHVGVNRFPTTVPNVGRKSYSIWRQGSGHNAPPSSGRVNWSHPLSRGLRACWTFNELGGKPRNLVTGSEFASMGDSPGATWTVGPKGGALNLSLSRNVTTPNENGIGSLTRLSVVVGVRPESNVSYNNTYRQFIRQGNHFFLGLNGSARWMWAAHNDPVQYDTTVTPQATYGNDYIVAGTFDGQRVMTYVDGVSYVIQNIATDPVSSTDAIDIGSFSGTTQNFPGRLYFAYIYDRALTDAEVRELTRDPYQIVNRQHRQYPIIIPKAKKIFSVWRKSSSSTTRPDGPVVLNPHTPLAQGLVEWWPLNDVPTVTSGTETVRNVMGRAPVTGCYGNEQKGKGTEFGRVWSTRDVFTNAENYFWFDTSRIAGMFGNQEATMSLWLRSKVAITSVANRTGFPFAINVTSGNHYPWTDGLFYMSTFRAARVNSITPSPNVDREQWHMVTVRTKQGANGWQMFQNLEQIATATGQFPTLSSVGSLGGWWDGLGTRYGYNGDVADIKIWNRFLTDGELVRLFNPATRWELYQRPVLHYPTTNFVDLPTIGGLGTWKRSVTFVNKPSASVRFNASSALVNGLVGFWPFTEGSGTYIRDVVHGRNMVATGGVAWDTTSDGNGPVLDFDGVNGYARAVGHHPDLGIVNGDKITIAVRFRYDISTGAGWLVNKRGSVSDLYGIRIDGNGASPQVSVYVRDNSFNGLAQAGLATLTDARGQWGTVVLTYDTASAAYRVYYRGRLMASGTGSALTGNIATEVSANTHKLQFGRQQDENVQALNGAISYVMIWKRVLTHEEVRMLE
jgi:hypothetical protein